MSVITLMYANIRYLGIANNNLCSEIDCRNIYYNKSLTIGDLGKGRFIKIHESYTLEPTLYQGVKYTRYVHNSEVGNYDYMCRTRSIEITDSSIRPYREYTKTDPLTLLDWILI
jgi:hypothetical protein